VSRKAGTIISSDGRESERDQGANGRVREGKRHSGNQRFEFVEEKLNGVAGRRIRGKEKNRHAIGVQQITQDV
jgi:hypothetical protein